MRTGGEGRNRPHRYYPKCNEIAATKIALKMRTAHLCSVRAAPPVLCESSPTCLRQSQITVNPSDAVAKKIPHTADLTVIVTWTLRVGLFSQSARSLPQARFCSQRAVIFRLLDQKSAFTGPVGQNIVSGHSSDTLMVGALRQRTCAMSAASRSRPASPMCRTIATCRTWSSITRVTRV